MTDFITMYQENFIMSDRYDLIIVGGGPAGLAAAQAASAAGKRILIMEKDGWGGTCTHRGCIPTKALLACSRSYSGLKKLRRVGIGTGEATIDYAAMRRHQQQIVKIAALGARKLLADAGVEIAEGTGEIISPREIICTNPAGESRTVTADHLLIAWGSEAVVPRGISLSERIMTSDGIGAIDDLPASIIIVGASFIGVEYAVFFAQLGVKVILVELLERILPQEDEEAAQFLRQELVRLGVDVRTGAALAGLAETPAGVVMEVGLKEETAELQADCALLCTGRKPVLYDKQLAAAGIAYDAKGIKVDESMMTSVDGIYAAGDVTGGMMLAHRATRQAQVAVQSMFGGGSYSYNENNIPSVVYSHPQIARVGYTQRRALAEGMNVEIARSSYSANIIARSELLGQGFAKALFYEDTIIGAVIAGDNAADLIAPLGLAVSCRLTKKQLQSWVIAHPTLSEIFVDLLA